VFRARAKQAEVLAYTTGWMGVSAVPGSGKTSTLSRLAAQLVASGRLADDQEVLVVTLVNSAVRNFSARVGRILEEFRLLPNAGYRVRTLHGLAHDIVRERPDLVGLDDRFAIIDERAGEQILKASAYAWVQANSLAADQFLAPDLSEGKRQWIVRDKWPQVVVRIARDIIRQAKDLQLTPGELRDRLDRVMALPLPLLEMGCAIYADYQQALAYRGLVDFSDLICLALEALERSSDLLERLRHRWPYILEDEAQDSSRLQEQILRILAEPNGNWVRVGDPNQAIYETFTTANPRYLREFLQNADVQAQELPNSGRSTRSIIMLANRLIAWTRDEHPVHELRDALAEPFILPTPPGDPQPNPADQPDAVWLVGRRFTPEGELKAVADSLLRWLPGHMESTVAVLVPRNERGFQIEEALKTRGLEVVSLLRSTSQTRRAAGALGNVINYLADPASPRKLSKVYEVWRRMREDAGENGTDIEKVARTLARCRQVEDFLWPRGGRDWLADPELGDGTPAVREELAQFRQVVRRWQGATLLPIDQLVLTLAQDLFADAVDLAVAHKLAGLLREAAAANPAWRLPELTQELAVIARNERRFLGLGEGDERFDPDAHKGKVVVATIHKAKGMEWDRVYLMSANNYSFPSAMAHDSFISEKWFIRGGLNLEAEAVAELIALCEEDAIYDCVEGAPTRRARFEYAAERVRLFYVGITRARKELVVTWNSGRRGDAQQAAAFTAVEAFWEERSVGADL